MAEFWELGEEFGGPEFRKLVRKMGEKGWICPSWPKEYGGLESSNMVKFAIADAIGYTMCYPIAGIGASMVGPTIIRYGSDDMKQRYLLPIARGEIEFCLGYTEPQAGSDLMAIEIQAEDKGDYFLVNGQKMFTSHAHVADYHWLAARTETAPDVPKHMGISLMIVDLKSPGITIRPLIAVNGWRTNEVFYDNVKVPKRNLVGEKNRGFYYMMTALDFERMFVVGDNRRLLEDLVKYTRNTKRDGKLLSKDPVIRQKLGQLAVEVELAELLFYQLAYLLDRGTVANYQASMQKVFASETAMHLGDAATQILGPIGQLRESSKWVALNGLTQFWYKWGFVFTVAGGTSEVQRNIIALRGLGL